MPELFKTFKMDLFRNYPIAERRQLLEDSCDKIIENYTYIRRLTEEELEQIMFDHADNDLQISAIQTEMKRVVSEFKEQLKPLVKKRDEHLDKLKNKSEETIDNVFLMKDYDADKVRIYSPDGQCIEERRMRPDERQTSIYKSLRNGTDD